MESTVVANFAFANYSQSNLVEIRQKHYHSKFQQSQQQEQMYLDRKQNQFTTTIHMSSQLATRSMIIWKWGH